METCRSMLGLCTLVLKNNKKKNNRTRDVASKWQCFMIPIIVSEISVIVCWYNIKINFVMVVPTFTIIPFYSGIKIRDKR